MKLLYFLFLITPFLTACSNEPTNRDLESLANSQLSKLISILHNESFAGLSISKISGVNDLKIESVEKVQCSLENNNSRIYLCDILVKYEIIVSQNSLSDLVGMSGKKSELRKIKLFKSNNGWEII